MADDPRTVRAPGDSLVMLGFCLFSPLSVSHYVPVATVRDSASETTKGAHRPDDGAPGDALRCVRFTFDFEAGALRRKVPDVLAQSMNDSGLDVSWTDTRSGLFGVVRRFTVGGSSQLVGKLIDELAQSVGWQPGAIALPALR